MAKPGRPRKHPEKVSEDIEEGAGVVTRDPHTRGMEHQTEGRAPRVSLSGGGKLHVPEELKEKGYFYYWPVDKPGELQRFQDAWYEFVTDENGRQITRPAGKGETHYLMRIKQEYYDEDIAKQQERVNDALIKSAKVDKSEGQYLPKDREGVLERDVIV